MSALIDRLRKILAQTSKYMQTSAVAVTTQQQEANYKREADNIYNAFRLFASDPTRDNGYKVVRAVTDAAARLDAASFSRAVLDARSRISSDMLLRAFDYLVQGKVDDAVETVRQMLRLKAAEELASKLGVPVEIVMESIDEKGKIRTELLAKYVKMRAEKLLGLAESGYLSPKEFKELVRDMRDRIKVGAALVGERFFDVIEKVARKAPTAERARKLVDIVRAVAMGDREAARTLYEVVGRKAVARVAKAPEQARTPKKQEEGEEQATASVEAERLSKITASLEKKKG